MAVRDNAAAGPQGAILMADDDDDDVLVARKAFSQAEVHNPFYRVADGGELMDFLTHRGDYADAPRPGLILLDLNMPGMDGREALSRIKSDPDLRRIPLVVFTTSQDRADVADSYNRGANSYIAKPVGMAGMVRTARTIRSYWFDLVTKTD
jgi:CheY-like chemotaxis protein